ncbi:MAG: hypothetical protein H0W73_02395 [Bacteroidetes bacterium]|nr:hypothetical protein [Bacteroidota bacterium]
MQFEVMETTTKKIVISKVNEIKHIDSLSGLQKELKPLLDTISRTECAEEHKQLQSIVNEIETILNNTTKADPDKVLHKTKKEISDVLCDLLCF